MGKLAVIALLISTIAAGAGLWFTATRAFWTPMENVSLDVVLLGSNQSEPFVADSIDAIRSDSSPLGFRACFTTPLSPATLAETYVLRDAPAPTVAPSWFDCFDAAEIGAALSQGTAIAVLSVKNIAYGVDRVIAVLPDGRGFAWHELNNCGRKAYDGSPVGESCPDRDTFEGTF